jgi:hypothetical protein
MWFESRAGLPVSGSLKGLVRGDLHSTQRYSDTSTIQPPELPYASTTRPGRVGRSDRGMATLLLLAVLELGRVGMLNSFVDVGGLTIASIWTGWSHGWKPRWRDVYWWDE